MDFLKQAKALKTFTDAALQKEFQQPTGNVPAFLIIAELNRRKSLRAGSSKTPASTVAEDVMAPFGANPYAQSATGIAGFKKGGPVTGALERQAEEERFKALRETGTQEFYGGIVPDMDVLGAKVIRDYGYAPNIIGDPDKFRRATVNSVYPTDGPTDPNLPSDRIDTLRREYERRTINDIPAMFGATDAHIARKGPPNIFLAIDQARKPEHTRETMNHEFRHVALAPVSAMWAKNNNFTQGSMGALEHPVIAALAMQTATDKDHKDRLRLEMEAYRDRLSGDGRLALGPYAKNTAKFLKALQSDEPGGIGHQYRNMPFKRIDTDVMEKDVTRRYYTGGPVMSDYDDMGIMSGWQYAQSFDPNAPLDFRNGRSRQPRIGVGMPPDERRVMEEIERAERDMLPRRLPPTAPMPGAPPSLRAPGDRPASPSAVPTPPFPSAPGMWGEPPVVLPEKTVTAPRNGAPGTGPGARGQKADTSFDALLAKYADKDNPYATIQDKLAAMEARAKETRGENINLALMQAGLGIASSKSPYLGQAVGEGALPAVKSFQESLRDQRAEEMGRLGVEAKLTEARSAYKNGEWSKAFGLYKEANEERYREKVLAMRAANAGTGKQDESSRLRLVMWKEAQDTWGKLNEDPMRVNMLRMSVAREMNKGKTGKDAIKPEDIPLDVVRRRHFESFGVPADLPQQLFSNRPGATPAKKPDRLGLYD